MPALNAPTTDLETQFDTILADSDENIRTVNPQQRPDEGEVVDEIQRCVNSASSFVRTRPDRDDTLPLSHIIGCRAEIQIALHYLLGILVRNHGVDLGEALSSTRTEAASHLHAYIHHGETLEDQLDTLYEDLNQYDSSAADTSAVVTFGARLLELAWQLWFDTAPLDGDEDLRRVVDSTPVLQATTMHRALGGTLGAIETYRLLPLIAQKLATGTEPELDLRSLVVLELAVCLEVLRRDTDVKDLAEARTETVEFAKDLRNERNMKIGATRFELDSSAVLTTMEKTEQWIHRPIINGQADAREEVLRDLAATALLWLVDIDEAAEHTHWLAHTSR